MSNNIFIFSKVSPSKARRSAPKSRPVKLEGPNIVFESRIAELEAQLTQAKIDLKKIQVRLKLGKYLFELADDLIG